jgi:hypothetical protein
MAQHQQRRRNSLCVDLMRMQDLDDDSIAGPRPPEPTTVGRSCAAKQWIDARLRTHESVRPGSACITESQLIDDINTRLEERRQIVNGNREMQKTRARLAKLPAVARLMAAEQQRGAAEMRRCANIVETELKRLRADRAYVRARCARDLLKQGDGEYGQKRIPIDPSDEPFVYEAILGVATRAARELCSSSPTKEPAPDLLTTEPRQRISSKGSAFFKLTRQVFCQESTQKTLQPVEVEEEVPVSEVDRLLQTTSERFRKTLRQVTLRDWHDQRAERAAGLQDLPRFNHEILPLLCHDPFAGRSRHGSATLQVRIPLTAIFRGGVCTNFLENNDAHRILAKLSNQDLSADVLLSEFLRVAPPQDWGTSHGCFIVKRLMVTSCTNSLHQHPRTPQKRLSPPFYLARGA